MPLRGPSLTETKLLPNIALAANRTEVISFTPLVSATTISAVPPPISIVTILVTRAIVFWKNEYGAIDSVMEMGSMDGLKYLW